jgi:hypothetical protein
MSSFTRAPSLRKLAGEVWAFLCSRGYREHAAISAFAIHLFALTKIERAREVQVLLNNFIAEGAWHSLVTLRLIHPCGRHRALRELRAGEHGSSSGGRAFGMEALEPAVRS